MIRLYLWFCRVLFFCTRTMGAVGTRPSLRPLLISRAVRFQHLGHFMPRERTVAPRSPHVVPGKAQRDPGPKPQAEVLRQAGAPTLCHNVGFWLCLLAF